jgi:5'(3')-deoxyribonucleotidase
MKILLDMDGVLADFENKVYDLFGHPREKFDGNNMCDIAQSCGVSNEAFDTAMAVEGFFLSIEPLPWCFNLVEICEKRVGPENVAILTKPFSGQCAKEKVEWVAKYLPSYAKRLLIGKAKHFCASPESILIDDTWKNLESFLEHGGQAILFPNLYNIHRTYLTDPIKFVERSLDTLMAG